MTLLCFNLVIEVLFFSSNTERAYSVIESAHRFNLVIEVLFFSSGVHEVSQGETSPGFNLVIEVLFFSSFLGYAIMASGNGVVSIS